MRYEAMMKKKIAESRPSSNGFGPSPDARGKAEAGKVTAPIIAGGPDLVAVRVSVECANIF